MDALGDRLVGLPGLRLPRRDPRMTARPAYSFQLLSLAEQCGGISRKRFLADLPDAGVPATPCWYEPESRSPEDGRLGPRTPSSRDQPHCPVAEWAADHALVWIPQPFCLGSQRSIAHLAHTVVSLLGSYWAGTTVELP